MFPVIPPRSLFIVFANLYLKRGLRALGNIFDVSVFSPFPVNVNRAESNEYFVDAAKARLLSSLIRT